MTIITKAFQRKSTVAYLLYAVTSLTSISFGKQWTKPTVSQCSSGPGCTRSPGRYCVGRHSRLTRSTWWRCLLHTNHKAIVHKEPTYVPQECCQKLVPGYASGCQISSSVSQQIRFKGLVPKTEGQILSEKKKWLKLLVNYMINTLLVFSELRMYRVWHHRLLPLNLLRSPPTLCPYCIMQNPPFTNIGSVIIWYIQYSTYSNGHVLQISFGKDSPSTSFHSVELMVFMMSWCPHQHTAHTQRDAGECAGSFSTVLTL